MIENTNDVLSLISLIIILIGIIIIFLRVSLLKRERKMIEKEIDYYREW